MLDNNPARAAAQRAFLDALLRVVPVCVYDQAAADQHASLLAHVRATGDRHGAHDLIIAATARAGRIVLTTDKRARFSELPEVATRVIDT